MSKFSDEFNQNNCWYQLGKKFAEICNYDDINKFLDEHNLHITQNSSNDFKKKHFIELVLILDKENIDTSELKTLYMEWDIQPNHNVDGYAKYSFWWGYDSERLENREVMTFSEASERWGLSNSTLRRMTMTERLQEGKNNDYWKSGKTWMITNEAMEKLYGKEKKDSDGQQTLS